MSEFSSKPPEGVLVIPKDFLEKRYTALMEKIANTPKQPVTPMRTMGRDHGKYTHRGVMQDAAGIKAFMELKKETMNLADDYYTAAKRTLELGDVAVAREFIDAGMNLLSGFDLPVPESFTLLNYEILAKV